MNTRICSMLVVLCSWIPDSRAQPALRNDRNFVFLPFGQIMAFIESSKLIQALERTPSGDKAG